jgi:hypothetical protein
MVDDFAQQVAVPPGEEVGGRDLVAEEFTLGARGLANGGVREV